MEEDSVSISEFADVAKRFCSLMENIDTINALFLLSLISEILAELYYKAMKLPVPDGTLDDAGTNPVDDEQYAKICSKVKGKFGSGSYYWVTLNPHIQEEPGCGCLGDDLADIYRDIREFIELYDKGGAANMTAAVWHWKFLFMAHWGYHAVDALRVLHWNMFA